MFTRTSLISRQPKTSAFKYMTMFFLGASAVMLATQALQINTMVTNSIQYIGKTIMTAGGANAGPETIILDGSGGNAFFSGNVGIGESPSTPKLTVYGGELGQTDASTLDLATFDSHATQSRVQLKIINERFAAGSDWKGVGTKIQQYIDIDPSTKMGYIEFNPPLSPDSDPSIEDRGIAFGSSGTEYMRIKDNGNVGIGTILPTEKFQIEDYAWIGSNSSDALGGSGGKFLRLEGSRPAYQDASESYFPNIQLNYAYAGNIYDRKVRNNVDLRFSLSTNGDTYTDKMVVSSAGNLGIGTTSAPAAKLEVNGNIRLTAGGYLGAGTSYYLNQLYLDSTNGYVGINTATPSTALTVAGEITATAYYYDSDKRLKTDISIITDPLQKILSLSGYLFTWKNTGKKDMGVIAQEVEKIFPEIVNTNPAGYKSVEYGNLVAPLIEAVKELNNKINQQENEIHILQQLIK